MKFNRFIVLVVISYLDFMYIDDIICMNQNNNKCLSC